ncbi:calcium-binding protein [Sphingobium sp. IP1]|nr:calcium-binding protein [Sphingobium sp. IP1]
MSADELDAQQPSGSSATPQRRPRAQTPTGSGTWSYRNCADARAAGAAPIHRGQPGYGAHMDGDGDGIACEPYRGR